MAARFEHSRTRPHPALPARERAHTHRAPFSESARTAHSVHPSSTFRRDETIEFTPKPGEDAFIGQAPVRPRGRSSSSSTNNHRISSKQQRSSSITNSPDPSIIISDAAEPTAAGSRGAPATRSRLSVPRRPFRGLCHAARGYRSAQRHLYYEHHNLDV